MGSENAAHRIAVEWDENGKTKEGVYVPRRDTNSRIMSLVGGRFFPGVQHHAKFSVIEDRDSFSVEMQSNDGKANVHVSGSVAEKLPPTSVFKNVEHASDFFERGSLGYSDTKIKGKYDGIELQCSNWEVEALDVETIFSSYFQDAVLFPSGSVEFDCALLMRNIVHEWHGRADLSCSNSISNCH